jgi:uncharacterized repeat protein (TIGR01451 family)
MMPRTQIVRWFVAMGMLAGMIVAGGPSPLIVTAAKPLPPMVHFAGARAGTDPRKPGDPTAAEEYFLNQRLTENGKVSAKARTDALSRASSLPSLRALPPAKGGKRPSIGKDQVAPVASWQQLGPAPVDTSTLNSSQDFRYGLLSGRATAVVVGPNTGVIYLGTADGGVWKSANDGGSWTPLTDGEQSLSIGSLALDPTDTTDNTVYAGTGETNYDQPSGGGVYNGDAYFGVGVLKTTNGGTSWTLLGQTVFGGTYTSSSLGIGVMAASGAAIWAGTTQGLYQSTDSGATWTQKTVAAGTPTARVSDMVVDGANVYVALGEAGTGNTYSGFYASTDGGGTWTEYPNDLPTNVNWARPRLAIARNSPQTLYLAISDGTNVLGLYKSTNSGVNWSPTTAPPSNVADGFGGYSGTIAVDPANANAVYLGAIAMGVSTDGGASWATIARPFCASGTPPCTGPIAADQHAIGFGPSGTPRPLYLADDGGIWKTANGTAGAGTTWSDLNSTLATTQFYAGDASANFLTHPLVAGGAQGSGSALSASATTVPWNGILGSDGGYVAIDKSNPNTVYAEYRNGDLWKTTNANAGSAINWTHISPVGPSACTTGALLVAPLMLDASNPNHLVFGGFNVCETVDGGATWGQSNAPSGVIGVVESLAIAPTNGATLYAGTDLGYVYKTTNGNTGAAATWNDCDSSDLPSAPITGIAVDASNPDTVYITFGNFGPFAGYGNAHVWKTTDCATWTNLTGTLPDVPYTTIATYPGTANPVLVVGSDVGILVSSDNGGTWSTLETGLPKVGIDQLFMDTARTTLFAATHGRGMWKIDIPSAPSVGSISPNNGPAAGGTAVTITGSTFQQGATVAFGGATATVTSISADGSTISATAPAHTGGTVDVVVTNPGNQAFTLANAFTYVIPDLTLGKSHTGNFVAGTSGVYTLTVQNAGTGPTVDTITVTDTLPSGLDYVSGTGTNWTCGAVGRVVTCTNPGPLLVNGASAISLTVNVGGLAIPSVTNSAAVSGGGEANTANDSATDPTTVSGGTGAGFTVTGFPSPTTANATGSFTVAARDANSNTATGYTGTVHFASDDTQAVLPADYTFTVGAGGDNGVHVFSASLRTAGTCSIAVTDVAASSSTGSQSGIVVNGAAAAVLVVAGYPSPLLAGASGTVTVTAKDGFNNLASGYVGTVHLSSDDAQATLPADYTFTAGAGGDNGSHSFAATLKTVGTRSITAADTVTATIAGTQSGINVVTTATSAFAVTSFPSPAMAGTQGNVTVIAKDAFGNTVPTYVGTVRLQSSDPQAALPANYIFQASDNGTHTFAVTLRTAGRRSITAVDTVSVGITGTQSGIAVNPGPATLLLVSGIPTPVDAGTAQGVAVTARDAFANTASAYVGTVHFISSDAHATLPTNYTFLPTDSGAHTFAGGVTFGGAGTHMITATDTGTSSITGTESGIVVQPVIASISPASGSTAGGTTMTLSGAGFTSGATVTFGTTAAANVTVANTTTIEVTAPAHGAGVVDVNLTIGGVTRTLSASYTYGTVSTLPNPEPLGSPLGSPDPLPSTRPTGSPIAGSNPGPLPTARP